MSLPSALTGRGCGLCLLSFDAAGSRGTSQLRILGELMHRINFDVDEEKKKRPCDIFDMIGGTGTGGFIAILLVVLRLTADQALEEFIGLSVKTLDSEGVDAEARTAALKGYINDLLEKHDIEGNRRLLELDDQPRSCKLVAPISYKSNIGTPCIVRNFEVRQEKTSHFTITEALLATLASPPLFSSTSIFKDSANFEYISGDFTLSNPVREIISEAYKVFGAEKQVACLLSIGCGDTGVISAPRDEDRASWNRFLEKLVTSSEQEAQSIDAQTGHLGIYHRIRVSRGLQTSTDPTTTPGDILAHTVTYLTDPSTSRNVDQCINSLTLRDGAVSLDQLKHSGGQSPLPTPLPPLTKTFVMRKEPWKAVEKALIGFDEPEKARMLAVTGIGGCGKTQLILKFMRVHKSKFGSMLFVDGSSESRIRADIMLHVRSLGTMHSQKTFEECLLFLAQPTPDGPRLLVYDNVDDPDLNLLPLLPPGDTAAVIITSRNRSLGELCPDSHLELDQMTIGEAVELLLYTATQPVTDEARKNARTISEALGCLPIALQQARSYMFQVKCSAGAYLDRLSTSREKVLAQPLKYERDMRYLSAYAAFDASIGRLSSRVKRLLRLLAVLHWSKFPLELIILAAKYHFSEYKSTYTEHEEDFHTGRAILEEIFLVDGKWDVTNLDYLVLSLQNYSLVTLVAGVGTMLLEMHPLLHAWVHSSLNEEDEAACQAAAILLIALGDRDDHTPSAQYLASHIVRLSLNRDNLSLNNAVAIARIMSGAGLYSEAILLQERAVSEYTIIEARSQSGLSELRWDLAETYNNAGRPRDAELLWVAILEFKKQSLGERHPDTIGASNNLANTYRNLGRLKEAEVLQEEVLKLMKELLGEHHPDTVSASNNLASTYHDLGRLGEAEVLQEEVLKLRKELLGEHHPDTVSASNNLASTYRNLGRLKEAEVLQEEALKLMKELLGDRHPGIISASNNLANTYRDLGRLKEAEVLQKEVLKLSKELLGDRHLSTITTSNNLANTYRDLGRLKEAEVLQAEALKLGKELFGDRHPSTINASNNLANTYRNLGRLKEAEVLQEEVLKLRKELLGDRHPDTISASHNLAATYCNLGRLKEAEVLQEEVLRLRKELLGDHHPDTIMASITLAMMYRQLGRLEEAEKLGVQALNLMREVSGERHPETCRAMLSLAETYEQLSKNHQALDLVCSAESVILETLGTSHHFYWWCQELKSRLAALRDSSSPIPVSTPGMNLGNSVDLHPGAHPGPAVRPSRARRFLHRLHKPFL